LFADSDIIEIEEPFKRCHNIIEHMELVMVHVGWEVETYFGSRTTV